jgi:hypothetical protein
MIKRQLALMVLLAGCAPQAGNATPTTMLVPGGVIEDSWAKLPGYTVALPGAPLAADFDGELLAVAYPYQLMLFRNGDTGQASPLPGVPKFVHVTPRVVVGLEDSLYLPGKATFPYAANDAIARADGVFWVDSVGLHRNAELIYAGDFERLAGNDELIWAVGEKGVVYPELEEFSLPGPVQDLSFYEDLYLLTPAGLYRLDRHGEVLNFRAGSFTGVRAGAQGVLALGQQVNEFSRRLDPR